MAAAKPEAQRLTLLVRSYCHLCDEMRDALAPLAARFGWTVEELDIDADAVLEKRWSDCVPVLLAGQRELCRYRIDTPAVVAYLCGSRRADE